MSWRDRLQQGTLDDIPFHTEQASGSGGRRVAVHEYPLQEQHHAEDLGKSAGSQRLRVFLIGADYDLQREQLLTVLDKPGPRNLAHPYLGIMRIQVLKYDWTITSQKGGYCAFTIEYVPAGQRQYPQASTANATTLQTSCNNASEAIQQSFAEQHSLDGMPAFVQEASVDQLTAATDKIRALNGRISSALQPLSDVANQIDQLGDEISTLILQPRTLAMRVGGVIASVFGAFNDIKGAFNGYKSLLAGFGITDDIPGTTSSRKRQATNQTATRNLLLGMITVETARFVAQSRAPFTTYNEAMTTRDALLAQIDALIETGTDAEYNALIDLQTALIRRIDDVAPGLQRIEQIRLQQPLPALALAHQLYGDATRADELVQRNDVIHPGFMPAGTDLEVLS